jgi:hypothetical protein
VFEQKRPKSPPFPHGKVISVMFMSPRLLPCLSTNCRNLQDYSASRMEARVPAQRKHVFVCNPVAG